jgi:hypothetical protein
MSEQTEVFQAMREQRRQQHAEWKYQNTLYLREHGLFGKMSNRGECISFTRPIKVDFYPSTGRWRHQGKTAGGGAEKFVTWYNAKMREAGSAI